MGKYLDAIGVWEHTIGAVTHRITPRMGDNETLSKIFQAQQKTKDQVQLFKDIRKYYFDLVTRSDNTMSDSDKEELQTWIEINQNQIMEDLMLEFKWTTKEELEKQKVEALKQAKDFR